MAALPTDAIIEKIRKLRRLAESGATQGEVDNATALVQRLMLEHGIAEAQLAIEREQPLEGYGYTQFRESSAQWRIVLLGGITRANGCRMLMQRGAGKHRERVTEYDVFGHRDSVRMVLELYRELAALIEVQCDHEWQELRGWTDVPALRWKTSWKTGAASTLRRRFWEQYQATQQATPEASTALIVIGTKVDEAVAKVYPKLGKGRAMSYSANPSAYHRGAAAGARMSLTHTPKLGRQS